MGVDRQARAGRTRPSGSRCRSCGRRPGSVTRSSSSVGTSPSNRSSTRVRHADEALRLLPEEPGRVDDLLDAPRGPRARGPPASGTCANSAGVTELTISSVDWADRIVATSSWNGESCTSAHSSFASPGTRPRAARPRSRARCFAPRGSRHGRRVAPRRTRSGRMPRPV